MLRERSSIIISVFSTSPGIGKTVTAINLAAGLASDNYKVCLVDLDLQFGDVLNYLKLSSERTIARAQKAIQNAPDKFNIYDHLINYEYGNVSFSILPPPQYVYDAYQIDVLTIENLIKQLVHFDFVVLDLSSVFSSLNLAMLDISTVINFLGVIDFLPALKNFKVGYDTLLRFEYEESKIRLVENRADSQKLIDGRDVERLLGEPFFHRLPNDFPAVNKSITEGRPLMFAAPDSRLTKSFYELIGKYTNRHELPDEEFNAREGGFFSKAINIFFG